jgi:hypothetical protein
MRAWTTAILVVGGSGLLVASSVLGGCTGDEFTTGAQGGGGASSSSPASSGDTSSSDTTTAATGGDCAGGCFGADEACHVEQSPAFCGLGGGACTTCGAPENECQEAFCHDGSCDVRNRPNLTPCSSGGCLDGECRADIEVCLNDEDEDGDDKIGCFDPDCVDAGYGCADGASGFTGPYLVVAGPGSADCPSGVTPEGVLYTLPEVDDCGCQVDEPCIIGVRKLDIPCEVQASMKQVTGECQELSVFLTNSLEIGEASCTAKPHVAGASATTLTMCPLPAYGCNANEGCAPPVPSPPNDFENLLCIQAAGNAEPQCPEGWNIKRAVANEPDVTCECTCQVDENGCQGTIETFSDAACETCEGTDEDGACAQLTVPTDGICHAATSSSDYIKFNRSDDAEPDVEATAESPFFEQGTVGTLCCKDYPFEE